MNSPAAKMKMSIYSIVFVFFATLMPPAPSNKSDVKQTKTNANNLKVI